MSNSNYPKGSEWRKWDIHIHCPDDVLHNQFDGSNSDEKWDKYLIKLEQSEIEIIGLTNYFCIDGYEKIKLYQRKGRIPNIKLILPNIEIRITQPNKKGEYINIHVLFSDKVEVKKIYDFLKRLRLLNTAPDKTPLYCSPENLRLLGYGKAVVELAELKFRLKDFVRLRDYIVLGVPRGYGSFRPEKKDGRGEGVAIEIDKMADGFFGNIDDIQHFLNINRYENAIAKPVISSSDAHQLELIGDKFSWIKADPTFEGLKQILYEPALRLKIQQEDPRENETYARIEKCIVNFPTSLKIQTENSGKKTDFCLRGKYEFEFSNNLTCIVGGRGLGKSTLLHLLYNLWNKKDTSKLYDIESPLISLDFYPDPLAKIESLTKIEIPEDTEFFLQNEIEKSAKSIDEMSKLVRYRLMKLSLLDGKQYLKDLENEWNITSHKITELITAHDHISDSNRKIKALQKQISTLKQQTKAIKSEEYKKFQEEIKGINEKIFSFKQYKKEQTTIIEKINELINMVSLLNWKEIEGEDTLKELIKDLLIYNKKLNGKFLAIKEEYEKNKFQAQLTNKKQQLKKYLKVKGLSPENIGELAGATEQVKELEDKIQSLEKERASHDEIYSERDKVLDEYKGKYKKYNKRFFEIASGLERGLKELPLFDKKISFTLKVNIQSIQDDVIDFVKKNSPTKSILRADDIQRVLFEVDDIAKYIADKNCIKEYVNKSEKAILHRQILQELVNDEVFLERLYLKIYKHYFDIKNIQVQTKLGNKLLQNTSFGERCGIVISIMLVAGTNPIIIDQPEDNLDGKFISKVLVPLIRKQKKNRQIILVTRDANIVIGGDAELIHILESDGNKIKLIPSTIENTDQREKYIWILDGGEKAFQKRERKYGFRTV